MLDEALYSILKPEQETSIHKGGIQVGYVFLSSSFCVDASGASYFWFYCIKCQLGLVYFEKKM
jgi:hypothetical protein